MEYLYRQPSKAWVNNEKIHSCVLRECTLALQES